METVKWRDVKHKFLSKGQKWRLPEDEIENIAHYEWLKHRGKDDNLIKYIIRLRIIDEYRRQNQKWDKNMIPLSAAFNDPKNVTYENDYDLSIFLDEIENFLNDVDKERFRVLRSSRRAWTSKDLELIEEIREFVQRRME